MTGFMKPGGEPRACFCIGPQNGEPYCPCQMRYEDEVASGRDALKFMNKLAVRGITKPRVRVKAISRPMP